MSRSSNEFELLAKAERELCDQAGPALAVMLRSIEDRLGVSVTEVRVTIQAPGGPSQGSVATCTIVRGHVAANGTQTPLPQASAAD